MGFFSTFWSWLSAQLNGYIGSNTALLAAALEPAVIALATLYVMAWGYLQLSGRIEEPIGVGLRRIVLLVVVLGAALHLWLYNAVIVDSFYSAPAQLAGALVGASSPVGTVDAIWQQGGLVAQQLWRNAGEFGLGFFTAGVVVWLLVGALCVYTMFLMALASIASAVLLAIGPLFIVMLLFDATRRFFQAWIAQLVNYALITILTVMVAALLLHLVQSYAAQTAALGSALTTMDALDMVLMVGLVLLLLRQIMPIAAGLAGGVALSSFSALGANLARAASVTASTGRVAAALLAAGGAAAAPVASGHPAEERAGERGRPSWRDRL